MKTYPLMTIQESLGKEGKVIHHIGGYVARELILKYGYSASHFVKTALNLDSGETEDYAQWTKELSNGGLLYLKKEAYELIKRINDLGKQYYKKENISQKDRAELALNNLMNNPFVKDGFLKLWGKNEDQYGALKMACKIYLNCLGKGFSNKCKAEVHIMKQASLKTNSLRKDMKNQKACLKCRDNECKATGDNSDNRNPKVTKTRKAPKGFLG